MSDYNECKIIDTINIQNPRCVILTHCGKFLIGSEGFSIFKYCLTTKRKFWIVGSITQSGHRDGTRDKSIFKCPMSLILSKDCKTLFIVDYGINVIRAICVQSGITTTFAGQVNLNMNFEVAYFVSISEMIKLSPDGNTLIVGDSHNLKTICVATGQVNTIGTFEILIKYFDFSPDGKHMFISNYKQVLKYNFKTQNSDMIFEESGSHGFNELFIVTNDNFLFVRSDYSNNINIFNITTLEKCGIITNCLRSSYLTINNTKLFSCNFVCNIIQVFDISKYCTNSRSFTQLQLFKHSFLPRQVIK
jgi:hypothetical protein